MEQLFRPFGRIVSARPGTFNSILCCVCPLGNSVIARCSVRADAFAGQLLPRAPHTIRPSGRVNSSRRSRRQACTSICRRTGDDNGSTQRHVWPSLCKCSVTPIGEVDVATLDVVLGGRSRLCAQRRHARLPSGSNSRPYGLAPAFTAFDHFRNFDWATEGKTSSG